MKIEEERGLFESVYPVDRSNEACDILALLRFYATLIDGYVLLTGVDGIDRLSRNVGNYLGWVHTCNVTAYRNTVS